MNFSKTSIIFTTLSFGMILIFVYYFFRYDKINASWYFPHDVLATGLILGPILGFALIAIFKAFVDDSFVPAQWAGITAFIFFLLSIAGGIHFTEPKQWSNTYSATNYDYKDSRSGDWYYINFVNDSPSSNNNSSWTDNLDDGGEGIVYLLIILVFIILLILSCIIPHFWVITCLSFISILMYWSILSVKNNNSHD